MSKLPDRASHRAVHKADASETETGEAFPKTGPFFRFRHSYTEISSVAGSTHVRSKETRFEDGRLTSESFEGTLGQSAYDDLVAQAQKLFASQTAFLLRQFSLFLPVSDRRSGRDE